MSASGRLSTPGRFNARRSHWSQGGQGLRAGVSSTPSARSAIDLTNHTRPNMSNPNVRSRDQLDHIKSTLISRYGNGMGAVSSSFSNRIKAAPPRARSATNLQAIAASPSNHRDTEDIMEEIIRLKRQIHSINAENSMLKTKLRKLEVDIGKKDKELEDLLDSDGASGYTQNSKETGRGVQQKLLMQSLKQKVVRLEQALRSKEGALNSLKADLKSTRLEELRVQSETMYHEILRLRHSSNDTSADPAVEIQNRLKSMQETILKLNEANQKLLDENRKLHEKSAALGNATRGDPVMEKMDTAIGGARGKGQEKYATMKREQLIAAVNRMEKQLANKDHAYLKAHTSNKPEEKHIDTEKENRQLCEQVLKLQREQNRMEKELEQKDSQISDLQYENEQLQHEVNRLSDQMHPRESQTQPELKLTPKPTPKSRVPTSRQNGNSNGIRHDPVKVERFVKNRAAKRIQRGWKKHNEEKDEALETIDSALRAHSKRRSNLKSQRPVDKETDNSSVDSVLPQHSSKRVTNGPPPYHSATNGDKEADNEDDDPASVIDAAVRGHLHRKNKNSNVDRAQSEDDEIIGYRQAVLSAGGDKDLKNGSTSRTEDDEDDYFYK